MQGLQTPLLAVRDGLTCRGDVRLREEQPTEPDLDVVQVVQLIHVQIFQIAIVRKIVLPSRTTKFQRLCRMRNIPFLRNVDSECRHATRR